MSQEQSASEQEPTETIMRQLHAEDAESAVNNSVSASAQKSASHVLRPRVVGMSVGASTTPRNIHHHIHHYDRVSWNKLNGQISAPTGSTGENSSVNSEKDKWGMLQNLKMLFEGGFIAEEEYEERRRQIVDAMTGTTHALEEEKAKQLQQRRLKRLRRSVVPHPPPDSFQSVEAEKAVKHIFDFENRLWQQQEIYVKVDEVPFAKGGLRLVYHIQELYGDHSTLKGIEVNDEDDLLPMPLAFETKFKRYEESDDFGAREMMINPEFLAGRMSVDTLKTVDTTCATVRSNLVAKTAIDNFEDPSTYFKDVEMQAHCAYYAKLYNSYDPPRKIRFCKAWIIELLERENQPLCGVEPYIDTADFSADFSTTTKATTSTTTKSLSNYRKHNNNFGYVSEDERNTPQAFSHFSYEASCRTMIVVDVQGVGDMYTDPQVHTLEGHDFGKGNLGSKGMKRFLQTHRCNGICKYLKLPAVNPKKIEPPDATKPAFPLMARKQIQGEEFREGHCFEQVPYLRKILKTRSRQLDASENEATNRRNRMRRVANKGYYGDDDSETCGDCVSRFFCVTS